MLVSRLARNKEEENRLTDLSLLITTIFGALMWPWWSVFTGFSDPWAPNAPGIYYFGVILLLGLLGGGLAPHQWWISYLGLVLGQVLYGRYIYYFDAPYGEGVALLATRKLRRSLLIVGFMSLPSLVSAYVGALFIRWRRQRLDRDRTNHRQRRVPRAT